MVQIIPAAKTKGERLSEGIGRGLEFGGQLMQQHEAGKAMQAENESLKKMGFDLSGIRDPKTRQDIISQANKLKGEKELLQQKQSFEEKLFNKEQEAKKLEMQGKKMEKLAPLQSAMGIVEEMRNIRKKGNLGIGSSWSPFASTQKDAATYEQLGKSLISYASTIPIRNQLEFETLAHKLYDPTLTDASAEGILNAMERIIQSSLSEDIEDEETPKSSKKKERPPLKSFYK